MPSDLFAEFRYIVMPKSITAHCCFTHSVLDTTKPDMIGGEQYEDEAGKHFAPVCECFSKEDADLICNALNGSGNTRVARIEDTQ